MCRLLGIVSSEPTEFRIVLREAPRSMAALSKVHKDGWGIAVFDEATASGWALEKGVERASEDERFHRLAVGSRGHLLVAHIRQRTVGLTSIENTHPFHSGRWIFAHNGTIKDLEFLRAGSSKERLAQVRGQTDSELFFAFVMTRFDEAGVTDAPANERTDAVVHDIAKDARARPEFGAFNFLLSDGATMYAHRFGRTLCLLERGPDDTVRSVRSSRDGTIVKTPWSRRRHAIIIASEQMTDEPWQMISEGVLLRIDRAPRPSWRPLAA
jgi:glutamine amidotransferase